MKERPILFKGEMVRAILEGRKTQTRRVMNLQPSLEFHPQVGAYHRTMVDPRDGEQFPSKQPFWGASDENEDYPSPFGKPEDWLWVKETFQPVQLASVPTTWRYRATDEKGLAPWKPSIFMPRAASRINLEITAIRVEQLQDISEADAMAEGVRLNSTTHWATEARDAYRSLWESINGAASWAANPWVWVIEFKRI